MEKEGYKVFKEKEIRPIKLESVSKGGGKRVDGIYVKDNEVLIGEIKSPDEHIFGSACSDVEEDEIRNNWGGELKKYFEKLNKKLKLSPREKGHLIHLKKIKIIANQIIKKGYFEIKVDKDKYRTIYITGKVVKIAYTVPNQESSVVENALKKVGLEKNRYKL